MTETVQGIPLPPIAERELEDVTYYAKGWPSTFAVARAHARNELAIWVEVQAERDRAHEKWKDSNNGSMERMPVDSDRRMTILTEEVGEAAKELNDYWLAVAAGNTTTSADFLQALRLELIQVAAMAGAWAERLGGVER